MSERLTENELHDYLASWAAHRQPPPESSLSRLRSGLQTDDDHLSYESMANYIDQKADPIDREIVEGHMDLCSRCANELASIRAIAENEVSASSWVTFTRLFTARRLRLVAAVATSLLVVTGSYLGFKSRDRHLAGGEFQSVEGIHDGEVSMTVDRNGLHGYPGNIPQVLQSSVAELGSIFASDTIVQSRGLSARKTLDEMAGHLVAPVDTAVDSTRPAFQWRSIPGA